MLPGALPSLVPVSLTPHTCLLGTHVLSAPSRYGYNLPLDWFLELIDWDGVDALGHLRALQERGLVHSSVPDPQSFVLGLCSEEEIAVQRAALSPADTKVIKGHLLDIIDTGANGSALRIKRLDGTIIERYVRIGVVCVRIIVRGFRNRGLE